MYRVDWLQSVSNDLARIWTNADPATRQAVTAASHRIDSTLERDPLNVGESRPGGRRVLFDMPLGALYRVDPGGRTVTVLGIWLVRPRRKP